MIGNQRLNLAVVVDVLGGEIFLKRQVGEGIDAFCPRDQDAVLYFNAAENGGSIDAFFIEQHFFQQVFNLVGNFAAGKKEAILLKGIVGDCCQQYFFAFGV